MIYLNNAATSYPKPPCVAEAVGACLAGTPQSQFRGGAEIGKEDVEALCRERLGQLLGIRDSRNIYFTSGATESLNTLLCGLDYGPQPGEIMVTAAEHNSVLRPLLNQDSLKKYKMTVVPCKPDGEITREALERTVTAHTRALVVNHCSNVTGRIQDMEMAGAFAREKGLLFLADVSQSAGCIPVEADRWGVDGLVFTGHKSLLGMQGTGGFYIRPGVGLKPLKYGGTGRNSAVLTYEAGDYEYETGTQNLPGITALCAGAGYLLEVGLDQVQSRERALMERLYEGLSRTPGVCLYGTPQTCRGPVMSLNFAGLTPSDAAYILQSGYGITVRAGLHCSPLIHEAMGTAGTGTVRVSVSYFTTWEEIDGFLEAARQLGASASGQKG